MALPSDITYKRGKKSGGRIWTDSEEESFIRIWSSKEALYSIASKDYHSHLKRLEAIDEIRSEFAEEFNDELSVEDVKSKIRSLRTIFGKEIAKVRLSIANGAEGMAVHKPTWRHFKALEFLTDNITHKGVQVVADVSVKGEENGEEEGAPAPPQVEAAPVCAKRLKPSSPAIKKHLFGGKFALKDQRRVNPEIDDADSVFGKHVAHTLRSMTEKRQKELLKMKIQNMIYEVQFGEKFSMDSTASKTLPKECLPKFIPQNMTQAPSPLNNSNSEKVVTSVAMVVGKKDTLSSPTLHQNSQLNSVVEGMNAQVFSGHVPPALSHFPQHNASGDDSL